MKENQDKTIEQMLADLEAFPFINPDKLPGIPLYMDQVTSLMEDQLAPTRRDEKDKLLTRTMINNYAKNHLMPAPEKKKYSREHILMLAFIYYFKGFLSLQDIQSLLEPLWKNFPGDKGDSLNIHSIYKEVYARKEEWFEMTSADILKACEESTLSFTDCPPEDRAFLQRFSLICRLGADIYIRKRIMEQLIDQL